MAQVAFGGDFVSDSLLEGFDVGEAAVSLAAPESFAVQLNLEEAGGFVFGGEGDLAEFVSEGVKEFRSYPAERGAMTAWAVADADGGKVRVGQHSFV